MRMAVAVLALLTLDAHAVEVEKTLALPRSLGAGEIAVIEVAVGRIARGQVIHVTTASGRELGVISPFGVRSRQIAGTYPLPVPADAIVGRQLTVRLTITGNGAQPRAPTSQEVRSVKAVIGGEPAAGTSGNKK